MKKKTLTFVGVIILMLIINSVAYAMTGSELQELCDPDDAEIISQYLDLYTEYNVVTNLSCKSTDEVIYEVIVISTNGEGYIIITVNGVIYLLKV